MLAAARVWSRGRERSKTTVVLAIHGSRLRAKELDRRLVERSGGTAGDLWYLTSDELDAYVADPASFADTIAERRRVHAELDARVPPFAFSGQLPPLETWDRKIDLRGTISVGESIVGLPGCPGIARGRARVVTDPGDPNGLEPGDVLIAPITDPSWTPLFIPAEAVVVDVGAVMSHAVIVSRELGIPCAVSVAGATLRIPDGALVEVDGSTGRVTVLELAPDTIEHT
ncbi:MAG: PEP-utilizing enzyme [Acidimicrobiales bacterium]